MTQKRFGSARGVALLEIALILLIFGVVAAILFPVFAQSRAPRSRRSCASNLKQVQLALLGYTQDYDEKLPPVTSQRRLKDGRLQELQWGPAVPLSPDSKQEVLPGIIDDFVKNNQVFRCPSVGEPNTGLNYLYNDLAATESLRDITGPANSVLTADGDNYLRNVGHSRSQSSEGDEAIFQMATNGTDQPLLVGAAVGDALTRHNKGGNYGFADGHVKWMKPEDVFFPPRTSNSSSHREAKTGKLLGPDPAGVTQSARTYQGKVYTATFHLR